MDWPVDVRSFADAMGLETFSVIGTSAGARYALACAALGFGVRAGHSTLSAAAPGVATTSVGSVRRRRMRIKKPSALTLQDGRESTVKSIGLRTRCVKLADPIDQLIAVINAFVLILRPRP
jgi:pimeloyl-ACP methyl ester carboxylesterase